MTSRITRLFVLGLLAFASAQAFAQSPPPAPLPAWEQLTPQQREALIAPLRDRWHRKPEDRPHMMERAQARHGMKRFEGMNPEQRRQARALYGRMKELTPEQRAALRDQWKKMTPEQREAWMQKNAPRRRPSREEH